MNQDQLNKLNASLVSKDKDEAIERIKREVLQLNWELEMASKLRVKQEDLMKRMAEALIGSQSLMEQTLQYREANRIGSNTMLKCAVDENKKVLEDYNKRNK